MADTPERRAKWEAQTAEIYEAIGRYTVAYSQMEWAVEFNIDLWLYRFRLQNMPVKQAILARLSERKRRELLETLIGEAIAGASDAEKKIIANIFKRMNAFEEERNRIIHSHWFVGWASEEDQDFSAFFGHKLQAAGARTNVQPRESTAEQFDELTDQAGELMYLLNRVGAVNVKGVTIAKLFEVDQQGNTRLPPGTDPRDGQRHHRRKPRRSE
jgi:hypothetical protein